MYKFQSTLFDRQIETIYLIPIEHILQLYLLFREKLFQKS